MDVHALTEEAIVQAMAEAVRAIATSEDEAGVMERLSSFARLAAGDAFIGMNLDDAGRDVQEIDVKDCMGVLRGRLFIDLGGMSMSRVDAIDVVARQAGAVLGCMAFKDASLKDVASRQVAEFESIRLQKLFDRRLEEALGERSVWAEIFNGSQYGVCIVNPELRYVSFNAAFRQWFARHGDLVPMKGQLISDALSNRPEIVEKVEECWRRALDGEDFVENWHMSTRGGDFHYETRYTPLLDENGERKGAVQFSLDVTAQVEQRRRLEIAETALRQSQKMEAVGKLTGGIAHDFNNILTGIVGAIDLISRKLADGKMEGIPRYLEMAATSADRAASLTHRLLAFSRRQPVDPRLTDVDALVLGMGEMIARTMGPDVAVETSTGGMSARVLCDASQLESALMNLVVNSREAMDVGGRLIIATGSIHLEEMPGIADLAPGMFVRVAVSDNGAGMSPEVLAHAVEPFFTTKGIGNGTGLGLSMVYGFARQSGGFLDIKSDPSEGTTVSIYLPATNAAPVIDRPEVGRDHQVRDATVLVVEDEPAVRAIVVELLEEMGCKVLQAEDGGQGAAMLSSSTKIDVLVTDIGLPVMNGRQVASAARAARPDIPILFMTGYSENATITEGFGGRTALVTKPFRPVQITNALEHILD